MQPFIRVFSHPGACFFFKIFFFQDSSYFSEMNVGGKWKEINDTLVVSPEDDPPISLVLAAHIVAG